MREADLQEVADIVEAINADYALWQRAAQDHGAELARRIDEEIMRVFGCDDRVSPSRAKDSINTAGPATNVL